LTSSPRVKPDALPTSPIGKYSCVIIVSNEREPRRGSGLVSVEIPTGASWLNLVERWFAELTTKKLQRSAHCFVSALDADIRARVATWNANPDPMSGSRRPTRFWRPSSHPVSELMVQDTTFTGVQKLSTTKTN
jgi:hypothetical protein